MADTIITTATVWPSENDVCGSAGTGAGRLLREAFFAPHLRMASGVVDTVFSGFAVPSSGPPFSVSSGEAFLYGYHIQMPSSLTISSDKMTASTTQYFYLRLDFSSGIVTQPVIETTTSATKPAYSIKLGSVTLDGSGNYSSRTDVRPGGKMSWGSVAADASTTDPGSQDWSAHLDATGVFHVVFTTAFLRTPICVASSGVGVIAGASGNSTTQITVSTCTQDAVSHDIEADSQAFNFVAMG